MKTQAVVDLALQFRVIQIIEVLEEKHFLVDGKITVRCTAATLLVLSTAYTKFKILSNFEDNLLGFLLRSNSILGKLKRLIRDGFV